MVAVAFILGACAGAAIAAVIGRRGNAAAQVAAFEAGCRVAANLRTEGTS